ncbi:unnamed protein product, partial [Cladocopium goreaui]
SAAAQDLVCEMPKPQRSTDGASRLDLTWAEGKGGRRTNLDWERLRHRLGLGGEMPEMR